MLAPRQAAAFLELHPTDLERLDAAMGRSDPEAIMGRFARGRRCFGMEIGGRVVSYGWVTTGPEETGELERVLAIPPDETYIWDCGTISEHRKQGHYTVLLNHVLQVLGAEGVPRAWIGASWLNAPSIRGIAHAGFGHVIDLTYRRFGRLTWIVTRPAPAASPELVRAARAILLKPGEWALGPFAIGWLS